MPKTEIVFAGDDQSFQHAFRVGSTIAHVRQYWDIRDGVGVLWDNADQEATKISEVCFALLRLNIRTCAYTSLHAHIHTYMGMYRVKGPTFLKLISGYSLQMQLLFLLRRLYQQRH